MLALARARLDLVVENVRAGGPAHALLVQPETRQRTRFTRGSSKPRAGETSATDAPPGRAQCHLDEDLYAEELEHEHHASGSSMAPSLYSSRLMTIGSMPARRVDMSVRGTPAPHGEPG